MVPRAIIDAGVVGRESRGCGSDLAGGMTENKNSFGSSRQLVGEPNTPHTHDRALTSFNTLLRGYCGRHDFSNFTNWRTVTQNNTSKDRHIGASHEARRGQ
eukprot:m.226733 g.226733  ORF g.226733 m.226733 type:complete len:101 (+) comp18804_c0_seq1:703-1005(+)